MDRKNFIITCCGAAATAFLTSCGKAYYATNTLLGKNIAVALSEFEEIKEGVTVPRAFVLVKNEQLPFPIAVYRKSDKNYTALYMECTHRGCELRPAPTTLQCPCHGSEFSTEGKILNPPADRDLTRFPVTVSNKQIIIQLPSQQL